MADIKEIAMKFYQPLRDGDTSTAAEFLSETWEDIPLNDGQTPGPSGFGEMVGKLRNFIPDLVWDIEDVIVGEDKVVVRSLISGTPHGKMMGIHFEGHHVQFEAIDIHLVQGDKIITTWHVEDKMAILKQFGMPHLTLH